MHQGEQGERSRGSWGSDRRASMSAKDALNAGSHSRPRRACTNQGRFLKNFAWTSAVALWVEERRVKDWEDGGGVSGGNLVVVADRKC